MNNPAFRKYGSAAPDAINSYCNAALFGTEFHADFPVMGEPETSLCRAVRLGEIDVLLCEGYGPRYTRRSLQHIRADAADDILIVAPLNARVDIAHRGLNARGVPGGFLCLDARRPLHCVTRSLHPRDKFSVFLVRIPAPFLRSEIPDIEVHCNRLISAHDGAGKIMLQLFAAAIEERLALTIEQCQRLGRMLVAAVINAMDEAPELAGFGVPVGRSNYTRVFENAKAYIEANLSSPRLSASEIAEHCAVSRRYVDMAFAENTQSIGKFIRDRRLTACRRDLRNARLQQMTIAELAFRWGFVDPAYFSRAYKQAFGSSPRKERRHD